MKIALVAPTSIPARRANTIQVMKMAQALAEGGHQVRLAAPGMPDRPPAWGELATQYGLQSQFPIEWLPAHPSLRRYDYGWRAVVWARNWQADLLYTRLPQAAAFASSLGMPTILEAHDLPHGRLGPWFFRRFLQGRGSRRLVAITQSLLDDLAAEYGAPEEPPFSIVAPDAVDPARYTNLPEPEEARGQLLANQPNLAGMQPGRFTAGYTGHLYAGRGAEMLLALAERLPHMNFLLAGGEAQDVERLRAAAQDRGLVNLILAGFVPNTDLPRYQAACDVLLAPYQQRVAASSGGDIARYLSPMKLFEYLACGRAILASDLPVLREVLHPGNAVLLPPVDVDAWAAALKALQAEPVRRATLAAQARCDSSRYTWERRAAQVLDGLEIPPGKITP